ncbi:MAG: TonB-dependent receptor [Cytophagales bacterium]|nr:TonB-dependent receptor [Cytophagales bacterium]
MKTIILVMAGWLCIGASFGHHLIRGVVINAEDQTPLIGAAIQIDGGTRGTLSDDFGRFEIVIEESPVTLIVSFVGFARKEVDVTEHDGHITVLLEPAMTELSQLRITSNKMNSLNSVSKLDLKLRPVNSSQEILRIVPGLFIAQHAGGGKAEQIFLRGFDLDHGTDINITVDDMPVNMVSHAHGQGYADLHFLIPELIHVVDFGKGPYYTDKGNLNTAGYVNFATKNSIRENTIKVEGGSFNTLRTLGMFDLLGAHTKLKGHQAYAAVEYQLTDGPFENPQNFNRLNLFTKYTGYFSNSNSLSVQFSHMNSKWDASGQIPQRAVDSGSISRFGAIDPTEGGFTSRTNASVRLTSNLPNGVFMHNQLFFSRYDFELYSNFTFYLNNPEFGDQIRQKEGRDIVGLNGEVSKSMHFNNSSLTGKIGYGFRYDQIRDIELTNTLNRWTNLERKSLGDVFESNGWIYADATLEHGKWLINGGMRMDGFKFDYVDKLVPGYETQSVDRTRLSPKLNVIYQLNDQTRFYAKSGIGFHSNDARVVVAEDGHEILPAAYGLDLGTTFKPVSSVYMNLAYWYMFMDQEFVYVGDEAVVEPSGKTRRQGIDLSLRWQANSWLFADFDLNYAHPVAIDEPDGQNHIPLAPTWTSIGGLTFQGAHGLSGSLRYRYLQDRPANEDNSIVAIGYTVLDAKINYTRSFYEFGLTVENLLDTDWNEAQFAALTRLKQEAVPVNDLTFTPGVPFFVKLSASFFF